MYTSLIPRLSCVGTRAWEWGYMYTCDDWLWDWLEFCLSTHAVPGEDGGSGSDEEGGRKVTFSYKSDRKAVREGPVDMGATLQLETEPEKRVNCSLIACPQPLTLLFFFPNYTCVSLHSSAIILFPLTHLFLHLPYHGGYHFFQHNFSYFTMECHMSKYSVGIHGTGNSD